MGFDPEFDGDPHRKHGRGQRRPLVILIAFGATAVLLGFAVLSTGFVQSDPPAVRVTTPAPFIMPPPPATPVPSPPESPSYHLIVNRETGQCFDVPYGSSEPHTKVEQFPVNGGTNQLWSMEPVPRDGVRIVNRHTGQCLDIPHGTSEEHVAVQQYPINGGSNQGWRLEPVGDHWYRIVNQHTGQCLEVPCESQERRTVIQQAPPSESTYQHWRPIAVR
jgi:hypothetical protein